MKTVLHVLNTGGYSGAENVVITLIRAFRESGKDARFIYVSPDGMIRDILAQNGVEFEPVTKTSVREIRRVIKKYRPDVIHAHDFTASVVCAAASFTTPVISHIHNNSPWIAKFCPASIVYGLSCLRYKKMLGVSPSVYDEFIFGKPFRRKEQIIGNPIDTRRVCALAEAAEPSAAYDLVALGRLDPPKDPLRFVRIVSEIAKRRSVTAVMVGDGELRSEVERAIADAGVEHIITLTGFRKNPYGILKNSRMLVMTSAWEGYGLVAVEALTLGKPVAATPVGGLPTVLSVKGEGRLCRTDDEFVAYIEHLLDDRAAYEAASVAACARAAEIDNMDAYVAELAAVYGM